MKSVFTQLHVLGLVEQEPLQDPVQELAKSGIFTLSLQDVPFLGRADIQLWEERRGNATMMRDKA